jgi:hypothetical protein
MHRRFLPAASFFIVLATALAPACGGATDPHDLLSGAGTGAGGHDAGVDTGSHYTPDSGGGTPDTSVPVVDSGVGVIDTGIGLPEASPPPDSGGGGSFTCPPGTCTAPDVCCATGTGMGMTPTFKCQAATKACGNAAGPGTPISCSSSADCNGEVCCGENLNGYYSRVSCQPTCSGTGTGGGTLVTFCDPAASDCPVAAPLCQPSQVLGQGFDVCNP